jgi:hypothetical protein
MFGAPSLALFKQSLSRDPLALLTAAFYCFTVPALRSMLLKLRFRVNSNPTLSAKLFKINKLLRLINPLAGPVSAFWNECSFARPRCVPLRLKPTDWESFFRSAKGENFADPGRCVRRLRSDPPQQPGSNRESSANPRGHREKRAVGQQPLRLRIRLASSTRRPYLHK